MTRTLRRIILVAVAFIVAVIVVMNVDFGSIGGPDRSVGNYCDAWLKYTKPKGEEYNAINQAAKDAKASGDEQKINEATARQVQMILGMPGDMAQLYDTVEKVAPSDIQPYVARAAQDAHAFEEQQRNVPTDVRSFGGGFIAQLMQSAIAGPTQQRIHNWNAANCTNLQGKNDYFN